MIPREGSYPVDCVKTDLKLNETLYNENENKSSLSDLNLHLKR